VRCLAALVAAALAVGGCGGDDPAAEGELTIAVNAPFSKTPYLGNTIAQGVELAVSDANLAGGVRVGDRTYRLRVRRYDNELSPRRALANVRQAVADGVVAIVDEGTGVDASWRVAADAGIPIGITFQGGSGLVDERTRPNVFRVAPTDRGIAFRLAEYLIPKGLRVALVSDDSGYGREGADALRKSFGGNEEAVAIRLTLPSGAADVAPEILRARRADADALLVWGLPATVAKVLIAARSAGWDVPVYTASAGADPLVRQQLAAHRDWVDGLTFASGRLTAEVGAGPWLSFQQRYEAAYGADRVGVKTTDGHAIAQPPETAMYSLDFVNVLVAALAQAGESRGPKLLAALEEVTVGGANGDERAFNALNHEGVVDDDVYFARFTDMIYRPVRDDPLSASLPAIDQRR
jgi:branched-chain amino acid transport system substrate-binding protein